MNYIYDIVLNLNKNNLYEFYEWKEEDSPEFILKIPIYKVDMDTFYDIKNNNIIINKDFLLTIFDKTEVYTEESINLIRYACIFAYDEDAIGVEFDSDGNSYMKSNLSIDDEIDVLEVVKLMKYSIIDYKIKDKKSSKVSFCTREEEDNEKYVYDRINNMYNNKENTKLRYIFFELYNEKLDNEEKIYSKLVNIIKNNDIKMKKLIEIINLMENKKIMTNNS